MQAERDFNKAYLCLLEHRSGTFTRSDGTSVTGTLFDFEDEADSPNGVAYVSLRSASGAVEDVYEDDFMQATFPDMAEAADAQR